MSSGFDQRKAPRARVELNCVFWPADSQAPAAGCLGQTINLSSSGLAMHCDYPVHRHDRMDLELVLPGSAQSLRLPAEVVDCRHSQEGLWSCQVRLSFVRPDAEARHALLAFLLPQQRQVDKDGMSPALLKSELRVRFRELDEAELAQLMAQRGYLDFETLQNSRFFTNTAALLARATPESGISVLAARPFHEGGKLLLELGLPDLEQTVWALAVVRWAREEEGLYRHAAGLHLLAIRKADALVVEAFVQRQGG
jgi:hypothetical protein